MSEIYIDKNGTTSTILENFDSLDKSIFLVWRVFQTFLNGEPGLDNVEIPPMAEIIAKISAKIFAAPSHCLISSEGLMSRRCYSRMHSALGPAMRDFDDMRTILTLRHPVERCASRYNQVVKDPMNGYTTLPDDYMRRNPAATF